MSIVASRGSEQFPLRLPDGMRDAIKAAAKDNGRSMNSEIVARLEASFKAGPASLEGEIIALLDKQIQQEVSRRLKKIAAQIGGSQ